MKTTAHPFPLIVGLIAAFLGGCQSPQQKEANEEEQKLRQQVVAAETEQWKAMAQAMAQERIEEAHNLEQNWSKLHEGMTAEEVEQLIGPFDYDWLWKNFKQTIAFGAVLGSQTNGWAVKNDAGITMYSQDANNYRVFFTLHFVTGTLKAWKKN